MRPGRSVCRPAGFALTVLALVGLPAVLLLLVGGVLVGGCTYYPTAKDVGGVRLQPEKGRAVRSPNAAEAAVYFVLNSTGKYGDVLLGAESPVVAKRAELRGPSGSRVSEIEIPGGSVVKFEPRGPASS